MTNIKVSQVFEKYKKARLEFTQSLADLSTRCGNAESMYMCGVVQLLTPLLSDVEASVQQSTALALGRLANNSPRVAEALVEKGLLDTIIKDIDRQSKYFKRSVMVILRGVAKSSEEVAKSLATGGALVAVMSCLEDFEPSVKEAAALCVSTVAKRSSHLAYSCIARGAVPLLKMLLQEPEASLREVGLVALGSIAAHDADTAQAVTESMAVVHMVKCLITPNVHTKKLVMCTLSNIAKHNMKMAEVVIESEIFPDALVHLGHPDPHVARTAAILVKEIVKHHLQTCMLLVSAGGLTPLVQHMSTARGNDRIHSALALGFVAAHSSQFAANIIGCKAIIKFKKALTEEKGDSVRCAIVWALSQIGKHTSDHAKAISDLNLFEDFINIYIDPKSSNELREKIVQAFKEILPKCTALSKLHPLVDSCPIEILKYVLLQFIQQLPHDPSARRLFVTSGNLKVLQELKAEPGTSLRECINLINKCFPEEIVRYYTPGFPAGLLQQVEQYSPQIPPVFSHKDLVDKENSQVYNKPPMILQKDRKCF